MRADGGGPKPALRHRIREQLREMILAGTLQPGERLVQMTLAKQFQVAQGVIREALLELSGTGLIDTVDHDGIFVARMDAREALENLDLREVLDGLAARICCQKVCRDDVRDLHERNDRALQLRLEGWSEEEVMLDPRFRLHERIAKLANHGALDRLRGGLRVLVIVPEPETDNAHARHSEHRAIIDAIANNQADLAEELAREHVRKTKQRVEQQIADGTFRMHWPAE